MNQARLAAILLVLFSFSILSPAFADEETAGDYVSGMGKNIGRGLVNVVTSPAEIPCITADEMKDRNKAAGFFIGLGKGTAFMLRRILVGVTEIGTFIIPSEARIPPVCQDEL